MIVKELSKETKEEIKRMKKILLAQKNNKIINNSEYKYLLYFNIDQIIESNRKDSAK